MRYFFLFIFLSGSLLLPAQLRLCSWNIQNFGKSKSDSAVMFMAETVKNCDVVAIVEVVAGNGGAQAVARLSDELNRTGSQWSYVVSDPTFSAPGRSERYAFLWQTSEVTLKGKPWLEETYRLEIEREPYLATFEAGEKEFTVVAFHALPKQKQPETEIKYFKFLPAKYPHLNLIFCGDFNCPQSHTVFGPLKAAGYEPALTGQKTSLKNECVESNCLASEYDNIFYNAGKIKAIGSGIIPFYLEFPSMRAARKISDHVPAYMAFELR